MAKRRGRKRGRSTAKQKAASRRNLEIARKKRSRKKKVVIAAATGVALGTGAVVGRHQLSGSKITMRSGPNVSDFTGKKLSSGISVSRRGASIRVNNPRDAAKSHRTVIGYEHKKLTSEVVGAKLLGGPRAVMDRRPPNARARKRMDRFNVPMTDDAKQAAAMQAQHSSGKVFGHRVKPKAKKNLGNDIVGGRGRRSGGTYSRGAGVHSEMAGIPGTITGRSARTESRGTTNPQAGRRISQDEVIRRTNAYMSSLPQSKQTLRNRRRASAYYTSQPLYTASGTPGRRGRARSREQRAKTK